MILTLAEDYVAGDLVDLYLDGIMENPSLASQIRSVEVNMTTSWEGTLLDYGVKPNSMAYIPSP